MTMNSKMLYSSLPVAAAKGISHSECDNTRCVVVTAARMLFHDHKVEEPHNSFIHIANIFIKI